MWQSYLRYKALFQFCDRPWLERWIQKEHLYDVLEFSVKFHKTPNGFATNPERYSLWKYDFRPERDANFLQEGFLAFEDCAQGTSASGLLQEFRDQSLELEALELKYFAFGMEIGSDFARTRLKTYAGYRYNAPPQNPVIVRRELDLDGKSKSSRYDGYPARDPRMPLILGETLPLFERAPFLYCVYVETGRLHFKSDPSFSEAAALVIRELSGGDSGVASILSALLAQSFQIEVITFRKSELRNQDVKVFTVYFRGNDWRKK